MSYILKTYHAECKCERCGYAWQTRWIYGKKVTKPKRCAKCRSVYWNTDLVRPQTSRGVKQAWARRIWEDQKKKGQGELGLERLNLLTARPRGEKVKGKGAKCPA